MCGEGLTLASDVTVKVYAEQGAVQRVLAGWRGPDLDFNAVFPRGHVTSPKVRAFVDFLVEQLNFDADYMQALCPNMRCPDQARDAVTAELVRVGRQPEAAAEVAAVPADAAEAADAEA